MLIVMNVGAPQREIEGVVRAIEALGFRAHPMPGATRTAIGVTGNQGAVDIGHFENLPGVAEVVRVTKPYKLTSRDLRPEPTVVDVRGAKIGGGSLAIIAGPCAIESRDQAFSVAEAVQRSGAQFFRGGAFKPRTSPYSFAGLGEEALKILADVRDKFGLRVVTEALDESTVDLVEKYADVIQIGSRNMQNFTLLRRAGRSRLPDRALRARRAHIRATFAQHARPGRNSGGATNLTSAGDCRCIARDWPKLYGDAAGACRCRRRGGWHHGGSARATRRSAFRCCTGAHA